MKALSSKVISQTDASIAVIGIGNIGNAVCNNLLSRGFNVTSVYDAYKDNLDFGNKVKICSNVENAVSDANVIITALPKPENIQNVVINERMFEYMREESVWIDHSTTDYFQTIEFAKEAKCKYNISTLECPMTGGITLLKQSQMTMFVGGDLNIFNKYKPILQCSSNHVIYLGEIGTASITKIVSNMLASTNTVAMGEALMIAKKSNIDLETFWNAIRFSAGNSFVWETEGPLVFNQTYDTQFAVDLQCKDMKLGTQIAEYYGVPLELHSLIGQIYNRAKYKYGKQAPSTIPVKLIQDDLQNESLNIDEHFDNWSYSVDIENNTIKIVHKFK